MSLFAHQTSYLVRMVENDKVHHSFSEYLHLNVKLLVSISSTEWNITLKLFFFLNLLMLTFLYLDCINFSSLPSEYIWTDKKTTDNDFLFVF